MGEGRNSVWLAKAGWTVSGYDISAEGLRQANAAAAASGVKLDTRLASHEEYELGQSQWDLIVMSFAFTKLSDTAYMKRVRDSLKPGGVLLVEGFNGGPRGEPNMILKGVLDYRVLVFEDLPDVADWGKLKAPLLRLALEKP
jgi:2-polyprenyl-3-methyl-5-hydroxy-6-metoxy-1,4-benzoquinol methylase